MSKLRQPFIMKCQWRLQNCLRGHEQRLREINGITKPFGLSHVIAAGASFQMAPVRDTHMFKDGIPCYATNVHYFIYLAATARKHNEDIYSCTLTEKAVIHAHHLYLVIYQMKLEWSASCWWKQVQSILKTVGLQRTLNTAIGLACATSVHVKTIDGLINGTTILEKGILVGLLVLCGYNLM